MTERRRSSAMVRCLALAACGVVVALPVSGAASGASPDAARPAARRVTIAGFAFAPATVTASVGDTLIWRNDDLAPHTATAGDSSWNSGVLEPGASWRMVLRERGEWSYVCALHPSMKGKLVVR